MVCQEVKDNPTLPDAVDKARAVKKGECDRGCKDEQFQTCITVGVEIEKSITVDSEKDMRKLSGWHRIPRMSLKGAPNHQATASCIYFRGGRASVLLSG